MLKLVGLTVIHASSADGTYRLEEDEPDPLANYRVKVTLVNEQEDQEIFDVRYAVPDTPIVGYAETMDFKLTGMDESIIQNVFFSANEITTDPSIDKDHLDSLAIIYYHVKQAVDFITAPKPDGLGIILDYQLPVEVYAYDPGVDPDDGKYLIADSSIHFGSEKSMYISGDRPMNREWHEIFHHLMQDTIGVPPANDCNHGGRYNPSTSDSWAEGWAEVWATVLQDHLKYPEKKETFKFHWGAWTEASFEQNWLVWDGYKPKWTPFCWGTKGSWEEFAVASLIWDLYDPIDPSDMSSILQVDYSDRLQLTANELWYALTSQDANSLDDVRDLYESLVSQGVGTGDTDGNGKSALDELFIMHGFFADDGDKVYQVNEAVGWGGETDRRSLPQIPGAAFSVDILEEGGESLECSMKSCPVLLVDVLTHESYFDYSYEVPMLQRSRNLIGVVPPPTTTTATVAVSLLFGGQASDRFTIDNQSFWSSVAWSDNDYIAELEFTFSYEMFLPFLIDGVSSDNPPPPVPENHAPYVTSNPWPSDELSGVPLNAGLSWSGGDLDGDVVTYDVYLTANDPTLEHLQCNNTVRTLCVFEALAHNTRYYWRVIATDDEGATKAGPLWSFTTGSIPYAGWQEIGVGSANNGGISNDDEHSYDPAIALDSNDTPYIVWQDWASGDREIYLLSWSGNYWVEVGSGSSRGGGISNNSFSSFDPSIAISQDDTIYVAWVNRSGLDFDIYVRRWNVNRWEAGWEEVGRNSATVNGMSNNAGNSASPMIAVGPDGFPFVAWADDTNGNYEIYIRHWNGSKWEEVGVGSSTGGGISNDPKLSSSPSIAVANDGTIFVAWKNHTDASSEIYVRHWNGSIWEEVGVGSASGGGISNNGVLSDAPSLALSPSGFPFVAWSNRSDDGARDIYIRRWNGSNWEEVGVGSASSGGVSSDEHLSASPSMKINSNGTPYVAWSSDPEEVYVRRWNGSNWQEVGMGSASGGGISNNIGYSRFPSLDIASDGTVYIAWADMSDGDNEVYVRRWIE